VIIDLDNNVVRIAIPKTHLKMELRESSHPLARRIEVVDWDGFLIDFVETLRKGGLRSAVHEALVDTLALDTPNVIVREDEGP
jgi:hypothetical protein